MDNKKEYVAKEVMDDKEELVLFLIKSTKRFL